MKITRILNNNSIVAMDEKDREVVLFGAGLGYMKVKGHTVEEGKIEKRFYMEEKKELNRFAELINSIPIEYIMFSQQIIDEAKIKYGKQLEDTIYISLPDHIANAVDAARQGMHTKNPMLWDIKRFYKDEFEIGVYALEIIGEKTGVELEIDEAAYIALHFVNAEIGGNRNTAVEITQIIHEISRLVKESFRIDFDAESLAYYRYITHLKFFAQKVLNHTHYTDEDEDLFRMVSVKYPEEYNCVRQISGFLEKEFGYRAGIDEMTYLTVHIARVIKQRNGR